MARTKTKPSAPVAASPSTNGHAATVEEARARLSKEADERANTCAVAIDALLKHHRCSLVPYPRLRRVQGAGFILDADVQVEPLP